MINGIDFIIINGEDYNEKENKNQKKTSPYLSEFEYSSLIMARMLQLSVDKNSYPLINFNSNMNIMEIATNEIKEYLPSLVIRRKFIDGSYEDWFLKDKELIFPR